MRFPSASVNQFTLSSCLHSAMHQFSPPSPSNGSPIAMHAFSQKNVRICLGNPFREFNSFFLFFFTLAANKRVGCDVTPQLWETRLADLATGSAARRCGVPLSKPNGDHNFRESSLTSPCHLYQPTSEQVCLTKWPASGTPHLKQWTVMDCDFVT